MEAVPQPIFSGKRVSVSDAKQAFFEGDFERCLAICGSVRVRTVAAASEVALIEARAYLRTGRPSEAQDTLAETLETHTTLDASLTAQMLLATARIRQNDADTGIASLADAAARSADAHVAIRSEIALSTALGYWAKRDLAAAERYLALVDPRTDIIHARALDLQAWCHTARCDYRRAANAFRTTLSRLDECQASDRQIEANAVSTLAIFAAELFDRNIAQFVEARAQRINWSSGLALHHFFTVLHQAIFHEFAGDTDEAYELATHARALAPTVPFEIFGWGVSAKIAWDAGEAHCASMFANRAKRLLDSLDLREMVGEERVGLLTVAENCARFDPVSAADVFARYRSLTPIDRMLAFADDPRLIAEEFFVEGVIGEAYGEKERALGSYRKAFDLFSAIGYVRRAVIAAHAVLKLEDDAESQSYIDAHLAGTTNYITEFVALSADHRLASLGRHPVVASLPRTQREVVLQICLGKTNKEIAQSRNVNEQTIKNMLTKDVFRAFGVTNRAALVGNCLGERLADA